MENGIACVDQEPAEMKDGDLQGEKGVVCVAMTRPRLG